jgi:hypothetical protein
MNFWEFFGSNPWKDVIEKGRSLFVTFQEQILGRNKNFI